MRIVGVRRRGLVALTGAVVVAGSVAVLPGLGSAAPARSITAAPNAAVWYGGQPGLTASTGARATYDKAQGQAAAKKAGKKVKLPKIKVGSLQIVGAVVSAQRSEAALKKAATTLGWQWVRCDAQGDPAKMESCGQSLLNQGVNVIFNLGVEPSIINATLKRAKSKKVLVIAYGGLVTPNANEFNFAPNEGAAGQLLSDYMIKQLKSVSGTKPVAIWDYPAIWATARTDRFKKDVQKESSIDVKYKSTVDGTAVVDGTRSGVATQLVQTPNLKGIWVSFDSAAFGAAQAVKERFSGKKFPNAPCIYTFHADQPNLDALRRGDICALSDTAYDNSAWIAVDKAAEWFARKKTPPKTLQGDYGSKVDFMKPLLVTSKQNLPAAGKYLEAPDSALTFFTAKWKAEFKK